MNQPAPDARSNSLHRRLTVALSGADERSHLADGLRDALAPAGGAEAPALLRSTDLWDAATGFADLRAQDRAELRARLEGVATRTADDHQVATNRLATAQARQAALRDGAAAALALRDEAVRKSAVVDEAAAALDERRAEHRDAQALLERVLEQRATAAAAVEEADRELAELADSGMDESGLRRELEASGRSVREAQDARTAAEAALRALEAEQADLEQELAELEAAVDGASDAVVVAGDVDRVVTAFDDLVRAARGAGVCADAAALADAWRDLSADLAEVTATAGPRPSDDEVRAADEELAAAAAELERLDQVLATRVLSSDQRAELDAAHAAVLDAEERSGRRMGAAAARKRLEDARATERALLDRHGFGSYLDVMLTGGRAGADDPARGDAERRFLVARGAVESLHRALRSSPDLLHLESERDRLLGHVVELLGVDPGDAILPLLLEHPDLPGDAVAQLRDALAHVGVRPVGVSLLDAAEAWLTDHRWIIERHAEASEAASARAAARTDLDARRSELAGLLAGAHLRCEETGESLEMAHRSVETFEAELTTRAGDDAKRLERLTAAEQLRSQVEAVEATLTRAESEARARLAQVDDDRASAEVAYDRAVAAVGELTTRAHQLAEQLPEDLRPEGDPLETLDVVATRLAQQADGAQPDVDEAEAGVALAAADLEEARVAADMAGTGADGPQRDDLVEGLAQLLGGSTTVLVLDEPFTGIGPPALDELLALVREGSADRQVVLLTEDPEILGWAIELPADIGTAVPADALLARAQRAAAITDQPNLADAPTPPSTRRPAGQR